MFAVNGDRSSDMGERYGVASGSAGEGRVLPRPMRRIVRFVVSLCSGRIVIPADIAEMLLRRS